MVPLLKAGGRRSVATIKLHMSDLTLSGIEKDPIRPKSILIPKFRSAVACEKEDIGIAPKRTYAATFLAPIARVEFRIPLIDLADAERCHVKPNA